VNNINKPVGYKILIYTTIIQVLKYFIKVVAYYNFQDKTTKIRTLYSIVTSYNKRKDILRTYTFWTREFFFPIS